MNNLKKILLVGLSTAMLLQSVAFAQPVTDFRFKSDYNVTLEGYGDSETLAQAKILQEYSLQIYCIEHFLMKQRHLIFRM